MYKKLIWLVVNKKIEVPKTYRKEIRKGIYYIKKYSLKSHLRRIESTKSVQEYLRSLSGKIAYILMINKNNQEFQKYKLEIDKIRK